MSNAEAELSVQDFCAIHNVKPVPLVLVAPSEASNNRNSDAGVSL